MRVLFLGSGAFGLPTLAALSQTHELVGIVSQPDRPAGRGRELAPTPIADFAIKNLASLPLFRHESVNSPEVIAALHALKADVWVVIAFGQKLTESLLSGVRAVNLHASLLPRHRGAAPINAAILAGDQTTGNSVITLAQRMDAGLVLAQSQRAIEPTHTTGELHDLLAADGPALVLGVLARFAAESPESFGRPQDETLVTKARKLSKDDGVMDWALPAAACRARINGLSPWPSVSLRVPSFADPLKVLRAGPVEPLTSAAPGTLIDRGRGHVACGDGRAIALLDVQPAGKKPMAWGAFLTGAGRALTDGLMLV